MNLKVKEVMTFVPGGKDGCRFFLQNSTNEAMQNNFRMENHLIDPAGVLWHVAVSMVKT